MEGAELLGALMEAATRKAAGEEMDREIGRIMDKLQPHHLGLTLPAAHPESDSDHIVRSQIVYSTGDAHELCIFLFPAGCGIPLHDHPGMSVFSKVLYGSLSLQAFDWEEPLEPDELNSLTTECNRLEAGPRANDHTSSWRRAARQVADTILTPEAPTFCLRPRFANIHRFTATSACAVVDLLLPPYDERSGRDCHYLRSVTESSGGGMVALEAAAAPPDFVIQGAPYRGPRPRTRGSGSSRPA